ncbi:trypsin-like serine peptidase [Streptomyces chattanoogensis]|uniref:Peptidase n=1 Tax=Streptomyces chattanoogensis TaxID=66876 RepID=A0A0N0XWZ2_9ACTN|nr:serine protease [Streptomyces chattanoogensis]KPC64244.1 peptidase [Streptomyces chattanoogensis]
MPATQRTLKEFETQAKAAARRYHETSTERQATQRDLDAGVKFPDSPEAIAARATRLLDRSGVPPAAAVAKLYAEPLDMPGTNERIIGVSNELQAWSFLPRGVRVAGTVARISVRDNGRELPQGTGFLVSPRLLMTNHHVLPDEATAQNCFVEFNAQVTIDNTPDQTARIELDPSAFFIADERLDFALVQLANTTGAPTPGEKFGWNKLSVQQGTLVLGEAVNIIGHPNGRFKEIAIRDNGLLVRLDDYLHYKTDTEPGNSGSPVFNDQWEVVALHHLGVPKTDGQGRILRKDGQLWRREDGDNAVEYISNEGIRISSILKRLAALELNPARRAVLAEMGSDSGLQQKAVVAQPTRAAAPPVAPRPAREGVDRTGLRARSTAFGGTRHLVFLHGRSQQNKDPEALRRNWTAGLNHGLTRAGIAPIDPADAWFPYYGDRLMDALERNEAVPRHFEELTTGATAEAFAPAGTARDTYEQLIAEAAAKADMPRDGLLATEGFGSKLVGALQGQLSWLAAKTDLDEWVIATILSDVAAYLDNQHVRQAVLDCVLETTPSSGNLVLVTHSLGTVVGMDLIRKLPEELAVDLLVTVGSPLGMNAVYDRLLVPGAKRPERVTDWFNAWCPTDTVTVGCPLGDTWGKLTEVAVANARDRAHDIQEYLAHPEVAAGVGRAIGPA